MLQTVYLALSKTPEAFLCFLNWLFFLIRFTTSAHKLHSPTPLCCEALEKMCGLRNFSWLPLGMRWLDNDWTFSLNSTLKVEKTNVVLIIIWATELWMSWCLSVSSFGQSVKGALQLLCWIKNKGACFFLRDKMYVFINLLMWGLRLRSDTRTKERLVNSGISFPQIIKLHFF